jgi:alpha-L-fucosidase
LYFSDAGPDIRWVGNESGIGGVTNWNVISPDTLYAGKSGINSLLSTGSPDGNHWIPAEVNTSIRPGWFYHASEDSLVKTPQKLFETYLQSVGRGSTMLLNIPPDRRGRFHENDVASLRGLKKIIDSVFAVNLAKKATASASNVRGKKVQFGAANLVDGKPDSYWCTDDYITTPVIELMWKQPQNIHYVLLQEYIQLGQRISGFTIETGEAGDWKEIAAGTTVGYKRILEVPATTTKHLRVRITGAKACPVMNEVAVY